MVPRTRTSALGRTGLPDGEVVRPVTVKRLDKKTEHAPNGCWNWVGVILPNGYGIIKQGSGTCYRWLYAHRVSYELRRGPIAKGLVIDHLCRNRSSRWGSALDKLTLAAIAAALVVTR